MALERFDGPGSGFVLVADFHAGANRRLRFFDGDPVDFFHHEASGAQRGVIADDHAVFRGIDSEHVERFARGKAETLTLPDGEIVDAGVAADHGAIFVYDFSFLLIEADSSLPRIGLDE